MKKSLESYSEVKKYIESLGSPQKLTLERIRYLLKFLGNPHLKFKSILVGGTSGKGSVVTFIASILEAQGYKVGQTISPHLQTITERIKVNQKNIPLKDFIDLTNRLKKVVDKIQKINLALTPTYFEFLTALEFRYFKEKKVDWAVVEVGLGGEKDATNVLKPLLSIITNVSLEHTKTLGRTLKEITKIKLGIVKYKSIVVSEIRQPKLKNLILNKIKKEKAKLFLFKRDFSYKIKEVNLEEGCFDLKTCFSDWKNLKISLLGSHQIENAALAVMAVESLRLKQFFISEKAIRQGLKRAFLPARLEIVQKNPLVVLDSAHNPAKVKALVGSLPKIFRYKRLIVITALNIRKDYQRMLRQIISIADWIVLCQLRDHPTVNLSKGEKIIKKINFLQKIKVIKDSLKALQWSLKKASKDDLICIVGLYLSGEIREKWFSSNI